MVILSQQSVRATWVISFINFLVTRVAVIVITVMTHCLSSDGSFDG